MKTTNKKTIEGVNFSATNVGRNAQNELKPLGWEVFTVKRGSATQDANMPPDNEELRWVANTATLIYGETDAILIDVGTSRQ